MSSDDPYGSGGGDWGEAPKPIDGDPNIDMNYGQPLPPPGQAPGQQQAPMQQQPGGQLQTTKPKLDNNDLIAIVINVFFPGVGQMMLGQTVKGIAILAASIFTCGGAGFLWVAVIIDAYLVAMTKKYRTLGEWEIFPDMNKHLGSG